MEFLKTAQACAVVMLLVVFVSACGGQDDLLDLMEANEQLQEEVDRLRHEFQDLMYDHSVLQAELRYVQEQVAAQSLASQSLNGEYHDELPGLYCDFWDLFDETYRDELGIEQLAWQNLGISSTGMEYMLWRGSWNNLANVEIHMNILSQQGWELVSMFQAGHAAAGGIVVVMRRQN